MGGSDGRRHDIGRTRVGGTMLSGQRLRSCSPEGQEGRLAEAQMNEAGRGGGGAQRARGKPSKGAGLRSGAALAMATVDAEVSTSAGGVHLPQGGGGGTRESRLRMVSPKPEDCLS